MVLSCSKVQYKDDLQNLTLIWSFPLLNPPCSSSVRQLFLYIAFLLENVCSIKFSIKTKALLLVSGQTFWVNITCFYCGIDLVLILARTQMFSSKFLTTCPDFKPSIYEQTSLSKKINFMLKFLNTKPPNQIACFNFYLNCFFVFFSKMVMERHTPNQIGCLSLVPIRIDTMKVVYQLIFFSQFMYGIIFVKVTAITKERETKWAQEDVHLEVTI